MNKIIKQTGKLLLNICMLPLIILGAFYMYVYETHPIYTPKSLKN
ncbi:MAG: hypothetical protein SOZ23_01385 [Methanosphaera sp.]|nr:hypothetical protein [Methanosphaera sp.]MDD6534997.1 hypothetical protein [Methanosphaera sp.]MDY3955430.1 hypothetical protein [Methanosphaera sp.]